MPNLHTLISGSFGVVKFCKLGGEGRMGWEGRVYNGVRMKHMNILYLVFVDIYCVLVI